MPTAGATAPAGGEAALPDLLQWLVVLVARGPDLLVRTPFGDLLWVVVLGGGWCWLSGWLELR